MPVTETNSIVLERTECPLCGAELNPDQPDQCPRCDWVKNRAIEGSHPGADRDAMSVILSVIPGLGHIYKGHNLMGLLFMAGGFFAVLAVGVIATFTMGFGVLLLPLYWVGVMMHVYWLEDIRVPRLQAKRLG